MIAHLHSSPNGQTLCWLSLSFIILVHVCYVVLSLLTFALSLNSMQQICWMFCLFPLSPLLPFIIYCASWPNSWTAVHIVDRFGLERPDWTGTGLRSSRRGPLSWRQFIAEKRVTNIGFIVQSVCESFPLSVIQIIAMSSWHEFRNRTLLCSLTLSVLSVLWKSTLMASGMWIPSNSERLNPFIYFDAESVL